MDENSDKSPQTESATAKTRAVALWRRLASLAFIGLATVIGIAGLATAVVTIKMVIYLQSPNTLPPAHQRILKGDTISVLAVALILVASTALLIFLARRVVRRAP